MNAILWRAADLFALLGGVILLLIVLVTTTNTSAFILDRIAGAFGADVSGLPGYEDFVQLAISGAALMFFPFCQANRGHVAVELFMDRFPETLQRGFDRLWLLLTAGIALFLAYWMVFGMLEARDDTAVTAVLGWLIWPFYLPGIASMVLWALVALAQIRAEVRHA
ncbi:TRAP transporter small permease [Pseudooceanicola nanhaiensis]|uniref:TRAP transporter small permease n=1 Tax=Pseudooceanicola nanhaiensis TaxID=375761 RepID=UPI001CD7DAA6|nr:TRAP transporter small permease [Pseudooceanicola nanhaiensis]MCA0918794.1 TRAP transporter small permease [Pseudooceanicola nanhaiensis]